jgi:hypothetical protein
MNAHNNFVSQILLNGTHVMGLYTGAHLYGKGEAISIFSSDFSVETNYATGDKNINGLVVISPLKLISCYLKVKFWFMGLNLTFVLQRNKSHVKINDV